jgi:NADH dehydrogenase FAD-containing subunit
MSERIVVLGGGYAGTLAALRMGRQLRGRALVTLVSASPVLVERIRLHQRAAQLTAEHPQPDLAQSWDRSLFGHSLNLAELTERAGVELVVERATAWRPSERRLELGARTLGYDKIVYALGSLTDVERVPGLRRNAFTLEPGSVLRLAAALPAVARRKGRLVVVGGGLTAIETATELAETYPDLRVEMVTQGTVGDLLSAPGRAHLHGVLDRLRIGRRERAVVREVAPDSLRTDGEPVPFDVCVWAGGFIPHPMARTAGLPVNERGQLLLDGTLRVDGERSIFGAGDAVAPGGRSMQMSCKIAMPMGAHVAEVISALVTGREPEPFRFRDTLLCISLGRRDALIQFLAPDGRPRDNVWTGRRAAWVKELICRFTNWSLRGEARGLFHYRWLRGRRLVAGEPKRLAA